MENKIRVFIIEDHTFTREGIKAIVSRDSRIEVVGESDNVDDGYNEVCRINPDMVLLDISLHGSSGLVLGKKLKNILPELKIIIITAFSKMDYVMDALESGLDGYILKESPPDNMPDIIVRVFNGEMFIDNNISNKVIKSLIKKEDPDQSEENSTVYGTLSFREQQILRLLVDGLPVKEIADQLFISVRTVENHKANIMQKLKCRNTVELVRYAISIGLIDV